jgi:hypothetical protein
LLRRAGRRIVVTTPEFVEKVNAVALLPLADRSWYSDLTDWRFEFFVTTQYAGRDVNHEDRCALARVVIEPDEFFPLSEPITDWTWHGLDNGANYPNCTLNGDSLLGVSTSRWGTEAFIWGGYSVNNPTTSPKHYGGVCSVDIDTPNVYSQLVSPSDWHLGIGAVAAHPYVSDLVAIAPRLTGSEFYECKQAALGAACADKPRLILAEKAGGAWTLTQMATMAPNPNATAIEWMPLDEPGVGMASGGGGGWKGELSWE